MTIEYENTLDDIVAFNLYHLQHSPTARRQLNFMRYGGAMVLAVVVIVTDSFLDFFSWSTGLGIVLIVGWILFVPAISRRVIKKSVGRLLVEGRNQVMLGKRTLKLQPDSAVEITDSGEISTKWH